MPKEIFPSSFECDCGHQSHFFENTVRELKAMSQKKKVYLADSAPEEHTIVFYRGKLVEIQCPKQAQSPKTKQSPLKSPSSTRRSITRGIPDAVKTDVAARVDHFNTTAIRNPHCRYGMSRVTGVSFSIWIGRIMGVSRPFVGWNTQGRWRIGHSLSTSTAMSAMMRKNGFFLGMDTSMAPLKGR